VFLINAVTFAGVVVALLRMNPDGLERAEPVPRAPGQLRAGLRYVRGRPDLMAVLALVLLVSTFGLNFQQMLAVVARNVFGLGPDAYGLLSTLVAIGSVVGAVIAARRTERPRLRLVAGSALVFGLLLTAAGLMPTFALTGALFVLVGCAALTFTTAANAAVQLAVEPSMRGRVMGLYFLLFLGGIPVGAPLLGVLGDRFGGQFPLVVGGVVTVVSVLVVSAVLARRGLRTQHRVG
jgi:predicted MFS family arabinose efflux permease